MGGVWRRWCFTVMRRPWFSLFVAFAILGVAMLPAFHLQRSGVTVSVLPESSESRRGVALLRDQFGPGEAAPLFVIVQSLAQIVALFALRREQPNLPRPYRMWLYPVPAVVAFVLWLATYFASGSQATPHVWRALGAVPASSRSHLRMQLP